MIERAVAKRGTIYTIGLIKVDGLESTEDVKKHIELEKQRKATTQDLKKYLDKSTRRRVKWLYLRRTHSRHY